MVETVGIGPTSNSIVQSSVQTYLYLHSKVFLKSKAKRNTSPVINIKLLFPTGKKYQLYPENDYLYLLFRDKNVQTLVKSITRLMQNCKHKEAY